MALKIEGVIYRPKSGSNPEDNESEEVPGSRRPFDTEADADIWLNDSDGLPTDQWKIKSVSNHP